MARDWLKKLRSENYPNQASLATAAGLKIARYSRIESGYCDLSEAEALALAKALRKPVELILTGKEPVALPKPPINASVQPVTPPVVVAPSTPAPAGDNLADPKNFTLLPPTSALERGSLDEMLFRARLQKHIAYAVQVLHTARVKPAVWVAWRDFERAAQNCLRAPHGPAAMVTAAALPCVVKVRIPEPPKPAIRPQPELSASSATIAVDRRHRGNKNAFGHFMDVSKETLPPEKLAALCALAAAAKQQQPEIGFMKHFKRLAETELPRAEFDMIEAAALRRE